MDDAESLLERAAAESDDLRRSAAAHGWAGLVEAMDRVEGLLEPVGAAVGLALQATTDGLTALSGVVGEPGSDAVARLLGAAAEHLGSGAGTATAALDPLADARTAAEQADAEALLRLLDEVEECLEAGRQALAGAAEAARASQAEAAEWGGAPGPPASGATRADAAGRFRVGVHDPEGLFSPKERAIADRLAAEGACVHPRRPDHTRHGVTNPDAVVRWSPADPGTITEFKTLRASATASDSTVKANVVHAAKQLRDAKVDGDVVIDTRPTTVSEADVRTAYARAAGEARQQGFRMPRRVRVILPSDDVIVLEREG